MSEQVAQAEGAADEPEVPDDGLTVLVIMPGFAGGLDGKRGTFLKNQGHKLEEISLPDPAGWRGVEEGLPRLAHRLVHGPPVDIVLASDETHRGGDYIEALVKQKIYDGKMLLQCERDARPCIPGSYSVLYIPIKRLQDFRFNKLIYACHDMCDVHADPVWKNLYTKHEPGAFAPKDDGAPAAPAPPPRRPKGPEPIYKDDSSDDES